jgi:4-amino-4-deoxy-L-arabinose transferase-like glycosyltransferase
VIPRRPTLSWFWVGLGAIGVGGLALRLWVVFVQRPTVDATLPGGHGYALAGDASYYHWQGRALSEGLGFIDPILWFNTGRLEPSAGHVPLYSSFLGVVSWFGAQGVTAHRVASSLVGVAAVIVIALVARKLAGDRAGLLAGGIGALYPQLWINDGMLLSESLAALMVAITLLVAYTFWERPTLWWAAGLGAAIGLTSLARAEQLLLFAFAVLPLVLFLRDIDLKRKLQLLVACGAVGFVLVAPWVGYNLVRFEKPVLFTGGTGGVLSAGSCDEVYYGEYIGYYANCFRGPYPPASADESVRDAVARDEAFEYIGEHKERLPIVIAARVGRVWGVFKPGQTTFLDWWLEGRGRTASWLGLFSFYALMPCAVVGVLALRRRKIPIMPLVALAIVVTLAAALSFGVTRYRAPAEVAIVIAAAVGIDAAIRRVQRVRAVRAEAAT